MLNKTTIDREAGPQNDGFRYQRLRAIYLLLKNMNNCSKVNVFASTEYLDDVYIRVSDSVGIVEMTEGDKLYQEGKKFSFMSNEVTNSLIIFFDNWVENEFSESLYYCFYTNLEYTKERNSKTTRELDIGLPEKPIFEYILNGEWVDSALDSIKKRVIYEYEEQYKKHTVSGYLDVLKGFSDEQWKELFRRVDWCFGQDDIQGLEDSILRLIKERRFLTDIVIEGREGLLISLLEGEFSKRESLKDPMTKFVSDTELENFMLRLAIGVYKLSDALHQAWRDMKPPSDTRNIKDKVLGAEEYYKKRKLQGLQRSVSDVTIEYRNLPVEERDSIRYRVFRICQEEMGNLLDFEEDGEILPVDQWLQAYYKVAGQHISELQNELSYTYTNSDFLKKIIHELIDSCYIAFDEEGYFYYED